jgi:hypothetical protein
MKILWFTIVVALMSIFVMAVFIQFAKTEGFKSTIFILPFLVTIYFYRKKVCYQCEQQDCPFHFKSKGNLIGFWLPAFLFFVLGLIIVFIYNYIF